MQSYEASASAFVGNVPQNYEAHMVPMLMRPYAEDLAERVANHVPKSILETAAGTGILTECLRKRLPAAEITATDLNLDMLDHAKRTRPDLAVTWQVADATALPFPDGWFDVVVMQFGYMFLPDKALGVREAHRVLRHGGRLIFNVWDGLPENELSQTMSDTLTDLVEPGPPQFLNVPFGYYDTAPIIAVLDAEGFEVHEPEYVSKTLHSDSALSAATGMVEGTPMYGVIIENQKDPTEVRNLLSKAFAESFGEAPLEAKMRAIVYEAKKIR